MLARSGWSVTSAEPSPGARAEEGFGRRSLLVLAAPAGLDTVAPAA
jgi:hypothetical protein